MFNTLLLITNSDRLACIISCITDSVLHVLLFELCLKKPICFVQLNIGDWSECGLVFKVYQSMLRVIKDSENVDERQHCFLIQTSGQESRYFSVETRQELLRIESSWHSSVCTAVIKLGVSNTLLYQ